ncbi:hypothetical protein MSG28_007217 [Choristoneura fumiferana]|uniref:Uncharacterized protein n=1 Tax=Choristoneura fumiferana TaxID=7141 RepID=A0ACC0JMW7_CHOFU|nr:hypothetical protein MSG28_007217 [Choristoneura fumiferana]
METADRQAQRRMSTNELNHDASSHPSLSELSTRVAPRAPLLKDSRLPLPGPQDIEAIKKVAQILAMLAEQVIPAIIGEPPGACAPATPTTRRQTPSTTRRQLTIN